MYYITRCRGNIELINGTRWPDCEDGAYNGSDRQGGQDQWEIKPQTQMKHREVPLHVLLFTDCHFVVRITVTTVPGNIKKVLK